jgi:hypothetical protein
MAKLTALYDSTASHEGPGRQWTTVNPHRIGAEYLFDELKGCEVLDPLVGVSSLNDWGKRRTFWLTTYWARATTAVCQIGTSSTSVNSGHA